ncbi:myosin XV [Echinococcus multilocularis]|uniref:Myosin XV n=1 Tax=Echinococcus multilocularis TaxID=6211 RepID=A0A068YKH5_ECHMU|nr:myosin XV [Echinococcus multilocularis]
MLQLNRGVRILFDLGYMKDLMGEVCSIRQDGTQVRSTIDGETYIGNILVTVNPYVDLLIDGLDVMATYRNQPIASMPPHVYGLAEGMYQNLLHDGVDQVVIISGESGAGKTEAFKRILRHLAASSEGDQITWGSAAQGVLESTPLLESFGNATTLRNDNSSRFGKFVEVFFSGPSIIGARVTNYLLEKSRVVQQSTGERNYHIFYQFLSGLDKETKDAHYLTSVSDFAYLQYGKASKVASRSDPEALHVLLNCWSNLRFTGEDMDLCLRIMSGVLHLGNVEFGERDEVSFIKNPETLDHIASELSINRQTLANVLTTKVTETRAEAVRSPVNQQQARVNRDSIAKCLYSKYFELLVEELNHRLAPPTVGELEASRSISLLDIYGFENLPSNSLEQLCINYANENLQLFFNRYVFELEQAEYSSEGVSWSYITFPDNRVIINLLTGKPDGIFHILNDEAYLGQGNDLSFIQKSHAAHRNNPHYGAPKIASASEFLVIHFAGTIAYSTEGLVEKNRDRIRPEALDMLCDSKIEGVAAMFLPLNANRRSGGPASRIGRSPTLLDGFHTSLLALMETMKTKRPWFVRCIKPNPDKKPMTFEDTMVMEQLRYIGILETVRIRSSGFPVRLPYEQFVHNYTSLLDRQTFRQVTSIPGLKQRTQALLNNINRVLVSSRPVKLGQDYEVGRTKVFLRQELADQLEGIRRRRHVQAARIIQRAWRRRALGQLDRARNNAATLIQAVFRGYLARKKNQKLLMRIRIPAPLMSMSDAIMWKELEEEEDYEGNLTAAEIASLPIPQDLAFVIEEVSQSHGKESFFVNPEMEVSKTFMVKRLMTSDLPGCWTQFKGDLWTAPMIAQIIASSGSATSKHLDKFQLGQRMAPLIRPLILNRPTQIEGDMAIEASKLITRLLYQNTGDMMDEFLMGSYLYQMALSNFTLFREILFQLLNQTLSWPINSELDYATDSEDEEITFSHARKDLIRQKSTRWKSTGRTGVQMKRTRHEISHKSAQDEMRRSHRRLWMHIAGILTCGRLPKSQRAAVVRHIRQFAPPRSLRFCEDRVVTAPVITRTYPPSMLEWRVNYTGTNMALYLTYPDGTTANIHTVCFSRADELANQAISLKAKTARLGRGWTVSLYRKGGVIEPSGHRYVMDMLSATELPSDWFALSGLSYDQNFLATTMDPSEYALGPPFVGTLRDNDAYKSARSFDRSVQMRYPSLDRRRHQMNGSAARPPISNAGGGSTWSRKMSGTLASSTHGINDTAQAQQTRGASAAAREASWLQAVRKMAAKRYDPPKQRMSIRRKRSVKGSGGGSGASKVKLPRAASVLAMDEDEGVTVQADNSVPSGPPIGLPGTTGTLSGYPPHEMRYLTYKHARWSLRVRKELITPLEKLKPKRLLDLVFCQIVGDVLENITPRLTPNDVRILRNTIGEILLNSSLNQLLFQPTAVKRMVIDAAKQCPYYFGRFYAIEPTEGSEKSRVYNWCIVGHKSIRFVQQKKNDRNLEPYAEVPLASIVTCDASFKERPMPHRTIAGQKYLVNTKGIRLTDEPNHVTIRDDKGYVYDMYTSYADDLKRLINIFVAEYNLKWQNASDVPKPPRGGREKTYVDYMSDTMSITSTRSSYSNVLEALVPFGREHFKDKRSIGKQLSWQPTPLKYGSLIKLSDPNAVESASRIFEAILELCQERQPSKPPVALVQRILKLAKRHPALQDEVFCQLVKQTNKNESENPNSLTMVWTIYAICTMFLTCSPKLRAMLLEHAKGITLHDQKAQTLAATVIGNLDKVEKYGPRQVLPPDAEVDAYLRGEMTCKHRINLPARCAISVNVSPMSQIGEVSFMLSEQLNITQTKERLEFTLFRLPSKPLDGIANLSLIPIELKTYYFDSCPYDEGNENSALFYRRVCWWTQPDLTKRSPEYIKVLFDQVVEQFLSGYWISTDDGQLDERQYRELIQMAVYLSFIFSNGSKLTHEEAVDLMPRGVGIRKREWTRQLLDAVAKCPEMTPAEARKNLIIAISHWPLYGATCFHGFLKALPESQSPRVFQKYYENIDVAKSPIPIIVAICRSSICFLHPVRRVILLNYPISDLKRVRKILSREEGDEYGGEVTLTFTSKNITLILDQASTFFFVLDQCKRLQEVK